MHASLVPQGAQQLLDGIALADRRIAELQAAEAAKKAEADKKAATDAAKGGGDEDEKEKEEEEEEEDDDDDDLFARRLTSEVNRPVPAPRPSITAPTPPPRTASPVTPTPAPRPASSTSAKGDRQAGMLMEGIAAADRRIAELLAAQAAAKKGESA